MRASAVEETATSKPTAAASDRIFVMINLLRFLPLRCCVTPPTQPVGYGNGRSLGLVQIGPVENGPVPELVVPKERSDALSGSKGGVG
jgi:hypothetical protein